MRKNVFVPIAILFGLAVLLAWSLLGPRAVLSQPVPTARQTTTPPDTPAGAPLTPTPDLRNGPAPTPPVAPPVLSPQHVDLAPNIPDRDKVAILIRHKDGRLIEYFLPPDGLDKFKGGLDLNDSIVSRVPPLSLMQQHPPSPDATPETAILPGNPPVRSAPPADSAPADPSSAYPAP